MRGVADAGVEAHGELEERSLGCIGSADYVITRRARAQNVNQRDKPPRPLPSASPQCPVSPSPHITFAPQLEMQPANGPTEPL